MFNQEFFIDNRRRLGQVCPDSLVVITANVLLQSSADLHFPFRQDSNFWYLTGLQETGMTLLIDTKSGHETIFIDELSDYQSQWDGAISPLVITQISGIENIQRAEKLEDVLVNAKKQGRTVRALQATADIIQPFGIFSNPARRILIDKLQAIGFSDHLKLDLGIFLSDLRMIKKDPEIEAIKTAIKITEEGLALAKSELPNLKNESEIEKILTSYFHANADGHGFEPIVAAGKNATTIHYTKNNQKLQGQSVLLDVGAKNGMYSADISRVWNLKNNPSRQLQDVHHAVLAIQEYAEGLVKPGMNFREYQGKCDKFAIKQLQKLGFWDLESSKDRSAIPHGVSHFLGIDVHDAGLYDQPLKAGSVITIEPGIYLPEISTGVRIEDNYLVTDDGVECLSSGIDKSL